MRECGSRGILGAIVACLGLVAWRGDVRPDAMPTVEVNHEVLLGTFGSRYPHVASFKGIPFAAPQPHTQRTGVQRADEFATACYQDRYLTNWYRRVGAAFSADPSRFADPP